VSGNPKKSPPKRCPACQGRGWIVLLVSRSKCDRCNGTGIKSERFDVEEGTPERFDDEGDTGSWPRDDS